MSELGKLIQQQRNNVGISQETLAKLVDYGRQHISSIESGNLSPSDDVLARIASELEIPFERLQALKILDKTSPEIHLWLFEELKARFDSSASS
ncbi:helix-turn-helix transcriptional regulator [Vampirovibrio sp.]|uniref:helix-turn-helix transcriptional regulator n=1 Tax=Vampirovibrio sp. TaxID=2717857 RepID=UPI003594162F